MPKSETAVFENFNQGFPEMAVGPNVRMRGSAARRDRLVREAYRTVNKQGWENCTIVNLHSFQLDLPMGYLGHLRVPAKKAGEMYALKVIDQPRFDARDHGDNNFEYRPIMPKELAEDLVNHYLDTGGVFSYIGTGPVPADRLAEAKDQQLKWYYKLVSDGNENWAQHNKNPKFISQRMRDAAKELWSLKLIASQPEWLTVTRAESPDSPCEGCGTVIPKLAKFCPHCSTIYDQEWVKVRRPDLWRAQYPAETALSRAAGKAGASDDAGLDKLIAQEEADEVPKAPKAAKAAKAKPE